MTVKSTLSYCKEMLRLSGNPYEKVLEENFDQRCETYVRKVIEYDRGKTLKEHLDELYELSPFPNDIRGYLHEYGKDGIFQPKHLMCKIATIRVPEITFEFLVEYGILESDVEIYYGIKAISDDTKTTEDFATKVMALSDRWFEYIKSLIKPRGRFAGIYQRHKFTNNVHDGTFWISWVRMESNNDLIDVINDLQKNIYEKFKSFLLKSEEEEWHNIHELYNSFPDIEQILDNRKLDIQTIDLDPELKKILDKACEFRDRNTPNGDTILKKRDDGRYQFNCDSVKARIFIDVLFNKEYYKHTLEQAKKFWSLKEKERVKLTFNKYKTEQGPTSTDKSGQKQSIDRSLALDIFRSSQGKPFGKKFFNRTVKFDDEHHYETIKEIHPIVEELGNKES